MSARLSRTEHGGGAQGKLDASRVGMFSSAHAARLFSIPESRLRYWSQTGFIVPKVRNRGRRYYDFQDLISIKVAKELLDSGLTLQKVRRSLDALRLQLPLIDAPLARLRIRSEHERILVDDGSATYEAASGQMLLDFDVQALRDEASKVVALPWVDAAAVAEAAAPRVPAAANGPVLADAGERSAYDWFVHGTECEARWDGVNLADQMFLDAQRAYEKAIELDERFAAAHTNLGTLLAQAGDLEAARDCFDAALTCDADQPEARCNLAELALRSGDHELAVEGFREVLRIVPDHMEAHYGLARALIAQGSRTRALAHLERFCDAVDRIARSDWDREMEARRNCAEAVISTLRGQYHDQALD